MCGIVGLVLKHNTGLIKQTEDVFEQLLYANALRGEDSTGVVAVEKDSTFHIEKEATPSAWFNAQYRASDVSRAMWTKGKALIGHNRKKTIGKIEDESAHPFIVNDEFAMVHNGTLYQHKQLADTEVDSEALAIVLHKAFTEDEYQEEVEETLGKVSGAYAVAMYDQRRHMVRLLRNKDRPLCIAETSMGWFFASEGPMLFWIMARNNLQMKDVKIELIPEHELLEFDLDKSTLTRTQLTPKKPMSPTQSSVGTGTKTGQGITFKKKSNKYQVTNKEVLSKNEFKRLRRKMVGTKIEWWCEDYIEKNFPKTEEEGETSFLITGVCDDLDAPHLIRTEADTTELYISKAEDMTNALWSGRIKDMIYDRRSARMVIELVDAAPLPISMRKPVIDAEYIKRKLDEKEKALTVVH